MRDENGKAVVTCVNYFIFSFTYSFIYLSVITDPVCRELPSPRLSSSDNSVWFLLIWFKLAQKKEPPSTHPLIGNGRSSLNIGVSAIAGVKLGSHRRAVFREEKKKKMNLQHCLWTSCLWILFKSFFFFLFKAVVHSGSCGALIRVSLTLRSAGVKGVNLREIWFVHHGPENAGTAARLASPLSLGADTKMFHRWSSGPDMGKLVCCFSCIMWFKGMFGTYWKKK